MKWKVRRKCSQESAAGIAGLLGGVGRRYPCNERHDLDQVSAGKVRTR